MKSATLAIRDLVFDAAIWPRLSRSDARVLHLADCLEAGKRLPAVKVERESHRVLAGWHTVAAYQHLKQDTVPIEWIDLPDDVEPLLFAYRVDEDAALPYGEQDARSVARRLYETRERNNSDGVVNVEGLADDLGRARQTVSRWVADLVAQSQERQRIRLGGRILAAQALKAADLSTRTIAGMLGISQKQVSNDAQVSITTHLQDSRIVHEAERRITDAQIAGALTTEQTQAARDWLTEQTQPDLLAAQQRGRILNQIADAVRLSWRTLDAIDLETLAARNGIADPMVLEREAQIRDDLTAIQQQAERLKERVI